MSAWTILAIAYTALEYYLGKTDRVKANSTLELVLKGTRLVLSTVLSRRK